MSHACGITDAKATTPDAETISRSRRDGADGRVREQKRAPKRGRTKRSRRRAARGASGPGRPGRRWPQRKKCLRRPVSPGHGSRRLAASGLREPLPIVRVTDACAILGYYGPGFQSLHMSFGKLALIEGLMRLRAKERSPDRRRAAGPGNEGRSSRRIRPSPAPLDPEPRPRLTKAGG